MWPGRSHFGTLDGSLRWRSRTAGEGAFTMMALDSVVAGDLAPRDLWPGADTGLARPFLLRAHPLLDDGVIAGEAFGRRLAHGSGEWQSAARSALLVRLRAAFFVDAARAWHGDVVRDRTLVDVGSGVRVGLPGEGTIRIDYAHGITDGANALSVGWEPRWPHQR
jgi:hypothetical protein